MGEAFKTAFNGYGIVGLLIAGVILGILARLVIPGEQKIPWWLTILAGIIGAGLGNVVAALLGEEYVETGGFDWVRHGLQLAGAVVAVLVVGGLWAKVKGGSRTAA